jgi:hypothetical protein
LILGASIEHTLICAGMVPELRQEVAKDLIKIYGIILLALETLPRLIQTHLNQLKNYPRLSQRMSKKSIKVL